MIKSFCEAIADLKFPSNIGDADARNNIYSADIFERLGAIS